jgi:LPS-assembly lipoprotein
MSWSETRRKSRSEGPADPGRRGFLRAAVGLALTAPALAACEGGGFRPMYASTTFGGNDLNAKMASVDIEKVPSRVGQRIRNELVYQSTGGGEAAQPLYKLEMAMRENLTSTLVRTDGDAASQIYSLDVAFRLTDIKTKKLLLEGVSYGRAGFERFTSIFSNVRAREDAENRAAKIVATDIKTRLSAYLATT